MNTLIFNGSPRPSGDTAALIDALVRNLRGRVDVVNCFDADVRPCVDCRACARSFACAVRDGMQEIYEMIHAADNVVIASPVWYSDVTGPLLNVFSRLQPGFYALRRGEPGFSGKQRLGGVLLAAGGSGDPAPAEATARRLLRAVNARCPSPAVLSPRTDALPAARDAQALDAARALAALFNARGG